MKGYDLLKEIEENKIKEKTKIRDDSGNTYIVTNNVNLIENSAGFPIISYYNSLDELLLTEFTVLEEIEDIEELDKLKFGHNNTITQQEVWITDKINELVRAVNKLIKEREGK